MLNEQGDSWSVQGRRSRSTSAAEHSPLKRFLDHAVDFGVAGVVFVAPLVMGGRHPIGRFVLIVSVAVAAIAWFTRQCFSENGRWRTSGAEWLILAGAMVILVQLVPLPSSTLTTLSPRISELLPMWSPDSGITDRLGTWSRISLTPTETTSGLVMFVTYATLFSIVIQRIRQLEDVERLLRWIAVAATGMAILGIAQRFFGNGHFFWVYEHPFRDTNSAVKGAFINENHMAHFLALGIVPLLWWLSNDRQWQPTSTNNLTRVLVGLAIALVTVAGLLTFSRGGVVVMMLACVVCVMIYARLGMLHRHALAALAGVGVLVAAALVIHGLEPLSEELASLGGGSVEDVDRFGTRRQLWAADLTAASQFPWLGTGIGSHADIYPAYFEHQFDLEYTHAENGYLQVLLESGVTGLLLLLIGIAMCCRWSFGALRSATSTRRAAAATVVIATLAASLVHSIWDFVWYLPACMSLTVVLIACGCRLFQLNRADRADAGRDATGLRVSRPLWVVATGAVAVIATCIIQERLPAAMAAPHWDAYLRQVARLRQQEQPEDIDATLVSLIDALKTTIDYDPRTARAHARAANLLVRQFEHRQSATLNSVQLSQVRQAALASHFTSRQAQDDWLAVAIGEDRRLLDEALEHVHQALKLCPLQGETYADLAELTFLEGRGEGAAKRYLEQALRVRPYSDDVLFAAGSQAAWAGDDQAAMRYWKAPFRRSASHRRRIIDLLADELSPSMFIKYFEPETEGLGDLYRFYQQLDRLTEASEVGPHYAARLERTAGSTQPPDASARQWLDAYDVRLFLDDRTGALRCIHNAVKSAPDDYLPHLKLAVLLIDEEQYSQAIDELNWCQRRKPQDQIVRNCLHRARVRQLRQAANLPSTEVEWK